METDTKAAQPVYQVPTPPTAKVEPKEVVYTAGVGDPLSVVWHHHRFVSGVPVMVHSEHILSLVDGNPSFSFKGQDKAKELAAKQEAAAKQADAERAAILKNETDEMTARHKQEKAAIEARHKAEADRMAAQAKETKDADKPATTPPAGPLGAPPSGPASVPTAAPPPLPNVV